MGNCFDFKNSILKNKNKIKGKQTAYYRPIKYKNMGSFDILTDTSEHVTLVKLKDFKGNVNCAISVVGYWMLL